MDDFSPDSEDTALETEADRKSMARNHAVPGGNMRAGTFVREVAGEVMKSLGTGRTPLNCEIRSRLAKFWYGDDKAIHYELAVHEFNLQIEIGLHAESLPERNRAFYTGFERCMLEIQRELGSSMWAEEWDRSWARIYETQALWPLDSSRVAEVAERVLTVISVLEPIYRAIPIPKP